MMSVDDIDQIPAKGDLLSGHRRRQKAKTLVPALKTRLGLPAASGSALDPAPEGFVIDVILGAAWYARKNRSAEATAYWYFAANLALVACVPLVLYLVSQTKGAGASQTATAVAQLSGLLTGVFALQKMLSAWFPSSAGTARCPPVDNVVNAIASSGGGSGPVAPGAGFAVPTFGFALPRRVVPGPAPAPGAPQLAQGQATFEDLVDVGKTNLQVLPSEVQDDSVTNRIFRIMIKSSAQAQLDRARVPGPPGGVPNDRVQMEQAKLDAFSVPSSLTVGELKSFAKKAAIATLNDTVLAIIT
jgi:hypothetical protein